MRFITQKSKEDTHLQNLILMTQKIQRNILKMLYQDQAITIARKRIVHLIQKHKLKNKSH